jgi:hypothetical protein
MYISIGSWHYLEHSEKTTATVMKLIYTNVDPENNENGMDFLLCMKSNQ